MSIAVWDLAIVYSLDWSYECLGISEDSEDNKVPNVRLSSGNSFVLLLQFVDPKAQVFPSRS